MLCDGFFFSSGAIKRSIDYETGLAGHYALREDVFEPDPLIMDERFIAATVAGRGLSVFSACSHAGIINACLEARKQLPGGSVDVVLGGYHLAGKGMEQRIGPTISDLRDRIAPLVVAPGHCTRWRAKVRAFAPGRDAPAVTGSLYRLSAAR